MSSDSILEALAECLKRGAGKGVGGLMFFRLDRATELRDEFGYTGLASLLDQVSDRLRSVGEHDGDIEVFDRSTLLLIDKATPPDQLESRARALFSVATESLYDLGADKAAITFSVAFAAFDHRFTTLDEMLLGLARRAESIHARGGNDLALLEPGISAKKALESGNHMLALLMEALRTDSMKVVFQHLLATNGSPDVESYQMLPRLADSDGHLIPAAEFLPQARSASLLPVIDRWMMVHGMRLLRGPFRDRNLRLFINQSEALLTQVERQQWLEQQFESVPEVADRLVIELRLDEVMPYLEAAGELFAIARERRVGICLSMVDEHSRWELIADRLEPDFIRMSPGFVTRLSRERELENRFNELVDPVRAKGTRVIVPMIENPEMAASMWRSGADFMQGNMIQAPEDSIAV
jgi:EAL domain-containing protein (putative c-di-GMP-specific phosphodiesterase class I)/GGDEF domain-containing protein